MISPMSSPDGTTAKGSGIGGFGGCCLAASASRMPAAKISSPRLSRARGPGQATHGPLMVRHPCSARGTGQSLHMSSAVSGRTANNASSSRCKAATFQRSLRSTVAVSSGICLRSPAHPALPLESVMEQHRFATFPRQPPALINHRFGITDKWCQTVDFDVPGRDRPLQLDDLPPAAGVVHFREQSLILVLHQFSHFMRDEGRLLQQRQPRPARSSSYRALRVSRSSSRR